MPLPEQVYERLAREPAPTVGWQSRLLLFSVAVLLLLVIIYLGMTFGYKAYLNNKLENINQEIDSFNQQISIEDRANLSSFYSQLRNLKVLLAQHIIASPFFGFLEKNTQSKIFYRNLNLKIQSGEARFTGLAGADEDLIEQLAAFQSSMEIERLNLTSALSAPEGINFNLAISFVKKFFKPTP